MVVGGQDPIEVLEEFCKVAIKSSLSVCIGFAKGVGTA